MIPILSRLDHNFRRYGLLKFSGQGHFDLISQKSMTYFSKTTNKKKTKNLDFTYLDSNKAIHKFLSKSLMVGFRFAFFSVDLRWNDPCIFIIDLASIVPRQKKN